MPQQSFYIAHHVNHIARFLQAGQLQPIKAYVDQLAPDIQQQLNPWLSDVLLDYSAIDSLNEHLPQANILHLQGWQAFYRHQYVAAHGFFSQLIAQPDWQIYASSGALGLAKVYTRTGHWQSARDWCVYYLKLARQHLTHFDIAKGYGALAEIFLRASYPKEALACFQTAYHLMPIGHGQQARQFNFMASALLRNQEWLRAETLLHTSRQISRNVLQQDPDNKDAQLSFDHSTMRLCYLNMLRSANYNHVLADEFAAQKMKGIKTATGAAGVPIGMMRMALGISYLMHDCADAQQQFKLAMACFDKNMHLEQLWAARLYQACDGNMGPVDAASEALDELANINVLSVPEAAVVVDQTWQKVALNNDGFADLLADNLTVQQLADLWQLFFI